MTSEEIEKVVERLLEANSGGKRELTWARIFHMGMVAAFAGVVFFADLTAKSFITQMNTATEQVKIDRAADAAADQAARDALNVRMLERDAALADQLERITVTQDRTTKRLDDLTGRMMDHD